MSEKLGPFELGKVHLVDAIDAMKQLPANSVHVIWTDPPYGINMNDGDLAHSIEKALGKAKQQEYDSRPIANDGFDEAMKVIDDMLVEANRVLDPESSCCCVCCAGGGGPRVRFSDVTDKIDNRMMFDQAIVWDKCSVGLGWKYRRTYEFVMVSHRKKGKLRWFDTSDKVPNIVRVPKIIPSAKEHPTPKPPELIEWFLKLHTQPDDIVLDPFCGGGSTGVACVRLGRKFLGFELEKHWVDYSNDRIDFEIQRLGRITPYKAKSKQQIGLMFGDPK